MAEGHFDEELFAARILMLLKKKSEARLLLRQHYQRMANLGQASQLFYSPHAQWGTNLWRFPSPLYDVTPMPPSYHFAQPPVHPGHAFPQHPMYYGMTASPHYNSFVPAPSTVVDRESRCRPNESAINMFQQKPNVAQSPAPKEVSSNSHKSASRRKRRNFSDDQVRGMEAFYLSNQNPLFEDRLQLEKLTKLSEDRIQIWFQNRRAKDRRKLHMARIFKRPQGKQSVGSLDNTTGESVTRKTEQLGQQNLEHYEDSETNTNDSLVGSEGMGSEEMESEGMGSEGMGSEGMECEEIASSDEESTDTNEHDDQHREENGEKPRGSQNMSAQQSNNHFAYPNAHLIKTSQGPGLQHQESSRYGNLHCFQQSDIPQTHSGFPVANLPTVPSLVQSPLFSNSQMALGSRVLQYIPHFQRVLIPEAASRQLAGLSFTLGPGKNRTLLPSAASCARASSDSGSTSNSHARTETVPLEQTDNTFTTS